MRQIMAFVGARVPQDLAVRLARCVRSPSTLVWQPEPPTKGNAAAARRMAGGVLLFEGRLVETNEALPWGITPPDRAWAEALHGHGWLDDAAAAKDPEVWERMRAWAWAWIDLYGDGAGIGWRPHVVARRLTRQIAYSVDLLLGQEPARSRQFFAVLGVQLRYLEWHWQQTPMGVPRLEALAGLIYALLSLEGKEKSTARAIAAFGDVAETVIGDDGAIASRNPEDLARAVILLAWTARGIEDAGLTPTTAHLAALHRAIPAVMALRHGDGSLARFHGGRSGLALGLEPILQPWRERAKATKTNGSVMGYSRLVAGPGLVILDGAKPPRGRYAATAHASALAFEMSYGAKQIVVNAGSGLGFGARMARAARRGPSHSTILTAERCPAEMRPMPNGQVGETMLLTGDVTARVSRDAAGFWVLAESEQYLEPLGLKMERRLHFSTGGRRLAGEDTVLATTAEARALIGALYPPAEPRCPIAARFLLHPDVQAQTALAGRAVALTLPGGERWFFRSDAEELSLEHARYFDENRPKPRAAMQILVRAPLIEYWGRITWSFERVDQAP